MNDWLLLITYFMCVAALQGHIYNNLILNANLNFDYFSTFVDFPLMYVFFQNIMIYV